MSAVPRKTGGTKEGWDQRDLGTYGDEGRLWGSGASKRTGKTWGTSSIEEDRGALEELGVPGSTRAAEEDWDERELRDLGR